MSPRPEVTCDDCFFRRAELCALPGSRPCPTFRTATPGKLVPPRHPQLIVRPHLAQGTAAA